MVFTHAKRLDTELVGKRRLLDHFPNDDGMRLRLAVRAGGHVAESV